ncbi:MAG TPA: hypothetical protein VFQ85_05940 [Mycobacteriales bacterium]|jgi:hypothetical protein|nr:hypothetical protein [Mycobacteriales bacterium]
MDAHASYAVFTTRDDEPPADLLRAADVPALDPAEWTLTARAVAAGEPLLEVLRTLAFEREPPIPKRAYPTPHLYRQAVTVEVAREDSLYPDAVAFMVGAVGALARWADGPVVDLTAERVWTAKEWAKRFGRPGRPKPFDARAHISIHASWAGDGRTATLHTHGMAKWAHPELVALDVPDAGTRAAGQLIGHLAAVRATTLEPLEPGHTFDPGFGQPMVAFLPLDGEHPVIGHLGAPPSVVVDYDVAADEAVDGLFTLLRAAKALDEPPPEQRRRRPMAAYR